MYKTQLIERCTQPGQSVLDCGCGRGGDFGKWKRAGVELTAVDPDPDSLEEASRRAIHYGLTVKLHKGDILNVAGTFDAVCYNFSIHYIRDSLEKSTQALARKVRPGGLVFGIVPDAQRMSDRTDRLGNFVRVFDGRAEICLVDGPFYAGESRIEPMIDRQILEGALSKWFTCLEWEPMCEPTGLVSDIYSRFIFKRK
jgi:SAM-dependent methyltransferase